MLQVNVPGEARGEAPGLAGPLDAQRARNHV